MNKEDYISLQLANIDEAISLGERLLDTSVRLHRVCDTAAKKVTRQDEASAFFRDTFKYYDFNDAAREISGMPTNLKDFCEKLIEIKVANDRMLIKGEFKLVIDEEIRKMFFDNDLCYVRIIDEKVLKAVKGALETLARLKEELK